VRDERDRKRPSPSLDRDPHPQHMDVRETSIITHPPTPLVPE
jgi:hypothetical protein